MAQILVIDDDAAVRDLVRLGLEAQGHRVVEATNGVEGLACYGTAPADVVITDMQMPVMDGLQMSMALRRAWPTAQIIALSGAQHTLTLAQSVVQRAFAKPFRLGALLAAVDDLVGAADPARS